MERRPQQVLERLGVGHFLQALDALVVVDAIRLHRGHGGVAARALLCAQHLPGVLERRLGKRYHVERVGLALGVEQLERGEHERRQRLVEREVVGQLDGQAVFVAPVFALRLLHHAGAQKRREDLVGAFLELGLLLVALHGVLDELVGAPPGVAALLDLAQHHRVRDLQVRYELFGLRLHQMLEVLLVPAHVAFGQRFLLDLLGLLRVAACLGERPCLLDVVLGRLDEHLALGVEARPARASRDLVELARVQAAHAVAVELGQRGEHDGVDGHVDARAQRVGVEL